MTAANRFWTVGRVNGLQAVPMAVTVLSQKVPPWCPFQSDPGSISPTHQFIQGQPRHRRPN
ncbi:hypothetical protein CROQUDRAFT_87999 [Cronartium quercuum f. sp. fusiforme G11]|uniref:Uncharacterized protein n=1 Tax=Cronartium quercuum f. sp. fusiforme G11 TaxID=708437 RepID=A0A9P6NW20_9BASI|nr:hypothetical protein CROQUDRAFT_87999 [Cronartium quercuum f. sp. fusiforme G11]